MHDARGALKALSARTGLLQAFCDYLEKRTA
jgi:hypothetical protein